MNKNVLIVKMSAIGDVIHALPVAHALKTCHPDWRIIWIAEKPALDVLADNPCIDEVMLFDKPKFKTLSGLLSGSVDISRQLQQKNIDIAIDLQGLFKSAAITWLSGAKKRYVYCNAREGSHIISKRICGEHANGHIVDRYLDVVRFLDCEIDTVKFPLGLSDQVHQAAVTIARHAGLDIDKGYIVLAPGTNWQTKCWPTTYFAALADRIYEQGYIPVVIGAASDERLFREISAQTHIPPVNVTGKTSLRQLASLISKAKAFVGGDTGPMHLAAAVETPVVALFGPTDAARNGPYGLQHTVLTTAMPCGGCWKRICEKDCLNTIKPDAVWQALQQRICHSAAGSVV